MIITTTTKKIRRWRLGIIYAILHIIQTGTDEPWHGRGKHVIFLETSSHTIITRARFAIEQNRYEKIERKKIKQRVTNYMIINFFCKKKNKIKKYSIFYFFFFFVFLSCGVTRVNKECDIQCFQNNLVAKCNYSVIVKKQISSLKTIKF